MLSIIVALIPIIHEFSTLTNPANATLGDKKQCPPIVVSCAIVHPILRIVFFSMTTLASIAHRG